MSCTVWSGMHGSYSNKMRPVYSLVAFFLLVIFAETEAQKYYGKRIGQLAQTQHAVKGEVYAVDSRTLHVKGFSYDGNAPDAFFYAGRSGTPSENGIIIPDENGRRDPLGAYNNKDVTITLPDGMTLKDVAWLSIWCRTFAVNFGSVNIPRGLEYPRPQKIDGFPTFEHGVKSDKIVVVDAQTFLIPDFFYDGEAPDAFFWVGTGTKPASNGIAVPDENGGREPIKKYSGKTIVITLPDEMTVFDVDYLGVWCKSFGANFGHVTIPQNLNIPPSLKMLGVAPQTKLNCEVLHDDLAFEVRWAVAGDSIVMQLVGRVDDGEYMSFGLSGSDTRSVMVGGDVTVAWLDQLTGRGEASDYYLDAKAQCQGSKGSCPDAKIRGGKNNVRLLNAAFINDFTMLTFQRPLRGADSSDKDITPNLEQAVIWAIGPVNSQGDTAYHRLKLRGDMFIDFGRSPLWNCPYPDEQDTRKTSSNSRTTGSSRNPSSNSRTPSSNSRTPSSNSRTPSSNSRTITNSNRIAVTTAPPQTAVEAWHIPPIPCYEPEDGVFYAQIGPTGGKSGYQAITGNVGWGISWYINGLLVPEVNVIRGKTYTFVVEGGTDPEIPAQYHPFYITDDPEGGYEFKTQAERNRVQVFAGVEEDVNGNVSPTAYGRLCEWKANPDSPANTFRSFGAYQRTLKLDCQEGQPGILQWTPDAHTPDQVYYQCYTHRNLGWKINVVDRCAAAGGTNNLGVSRADYDYYDDDPVSIDSDDTIPVEGSRRYETNLNPRQENLTDNDIKYGNFENHDINPTRSSDPYDVDVASFDSFPFGIFSKSPESEISNYINKPESKVPLGAPGFEFPKLPPFKKTSINATGFKTLDSFQRRTPKPYFPRKPLFSFEKKEISFDGPPESDSIRDNILTPKFEKGNPETGTAFDRASGGPSFDVPWDSKRTNDSTFPRFDFDWGETSQSPNLPNKFEYSIGEIESHQGESIAKEQLYNYDYPSPETLEYDDLRHALPNLGLQGTSVKGVSLSDFKFPEAAVDEVGSVYNSPSPKIISSQRPQMPYSETPIRPTNNKPATSYRKDTYQHLEREEITPIRPTKNKPATSYRKDTYQYPEKDENTSIYREDVIEHSLNSPNRLPTSHVIQNGPSVISLKPIGVLHNPTKRPSTSNAPKTILKNHYENWNQNHKDIIGQANTQTYLPLNKNRQNSDKLASSKSKGIFPSVDSTSRPTELFEFQNEYREVDPKTGLPYAVNEGFDPSTVVFENDFLPVAKKDLPNKFMNFQVSSTNSQAVSKPYEPPRPFEISQDSNLPNQVIKSDILSKYYAEVLQQPAQAIVVSNAEPFGTHRNLHKQRNNKVVFQNRPPSRRPPLPAFKLRPPPDDHYKRFARRTYPESSIPVDEDTIFVDNDTIFVNNDSISVDKPDTRVRRKRSEPTNKITRNLFNNYYELSHALLYPQSRNIPKLDRSHKEIQRAQDRNDVENQFHTNDFPLNKNLNKPDLSRQKNLPIIAPSSYTRPALIKYLPKKQLPPPIVEKIVHPTEDHSLVDDINPYERVLQLSEEKVSRDTMPTRSTRRQENTRDRKLTPTQATHLLILKDIWDNLAELQIHEEFEEY